MHKYAQTNIQLYNELQQKDYPVEDLVRVHNAYQLGIKLMAAHFRPSGKPIEAHLVGTASILSHLDAPLHVIITGLLHAVHVHGDFGGLSKSSPEARSHVLRAVVGEQVEQLLLAYTTLPWTSAFILNANQNLAQKTPLEKEVLLIRLANELEDSLDLGILFCPNRKARQNFMERCSSDMVSLATALGQPSLAGELKEAHRAILDFPDLESLPIACDNPRDHLVAPSSYQQRLLPAACRGATYWAGRISRKAKNILARKSQ